MSRRGLAFEKGHFSLGPLNGGSPDADGRSRLVDARAAPASWKTYIGRDALGSRHPEDKETAIRRMERHGAEIVTTEMVVFEWLQTADDARLRRAIQIVK